MKYMIVDTVTGISEPLLDAEAYPGIWQGDPQWSCDGRFIISPVYSNGENWIAIQDSITREIVKKGWLPSFEYYQMIIAPDDDLVAYKAGGKLKGIFITRISTGESWWATKDSYYLLGWTGDCKELIVDDYHQKVLKVPAFP